MLDLKDATGLIRATRELIHLGEDVNGYSSNNVEPQGVASIPAMQRGPEPWRETMNVLQIVRKQVQKKTALKGSQKASLRVQPINLVYRGVPYEVIK